MSKIHCRVHHKDAGLEDHSHKLPDGSYTGGMLLKPNSNQSYPHTHIYQYMGKTIETSPAKVGGDHTHISEDGVTSGPVPPHMDAAAHVDYIQRVGSQFAVFSESGHMIGKHPTKEGAVKQLQAIEANKAS